MKSLSPKQAKKLIAFLIEHPDKKTRFNKIVYQLMADKIYKICRSVYADSNLKWKKDAVELFESHKL